MGKKLSSVEKAKLAKIMSDPVLWARAFLISNDAATKKKGPWKARDYQEEMLRDNSLRKVYRCGRRCIAGNTNIHLADGNIVPVESLCDKEFKIVALNMEQDKLVETTKNNTGLTFVFAINYGARDEITRAVRDLLNDYKSGKVSDIENVDESFFEKYLDTYPDPDPDLLIRTSGELRISNYLLWQIAYSEIYVTDVLWPDFDMAELENAITAYNKRERRFGGR